MKPLAEFERAVGDVLAVGTRFSHLTRCMTEVEIKTWPEYRGSALKLAHRPVVVHGGSS